MKNRLLKNTIIIAIGTFCTKIISFIMIPIYTYWLNPSQFGQFDLLNSYLSLAVPIITLELQQVVFKWSLTKKYNSKQILMNSLIISLINIIFVDLFCIIFLRNKLYIFPFVLYFDSYAIFVLLSEYLRGNSKLIKYSLYNIFVSVFTIILSFIFVLMFNMNVNGLLFSYGFSYFLVNIFIVFFENILIRPKLLKKKIIKEMTAFSIPLIPNSISWWITNVSDRTIIKFFIGDFYNGLYAVGCKIPTMISLIYSIFNLSWQQEAILSFDNKDRNDKYNNIFDQLINFMFGMSFIVITFLPIFFFKFIDKNYSSAITLTPILILGSIFLSFSQFLGSILLALNETKKIGSTTVVAAVINLIINLIFMKKFGLIVAGISTLLAYLFFFISRFFILKDVFMKKNLYKILLLVIVYFLLYFTVIKISNSLLYLFVIILIVVLAIIMNRYTLNLIFKKKK